MSRARNTNERLSNIKKTQDSENHRYVRYNKEQDPENFFREQLMLFYPWRDESKDLIGDFQTFEEHYNVKISIINANKGKYEMDNGVTDIIENSYEEIQEANPIVFLVKSNITKQLTMRSSLPAKMYLMAVSTQRNWDMNMM